MDKLAILLVDVEERYTNPDEILYNIIDGDLDPYDVAEEIEQKFQKIADYIRCLNRGDVFITHKSEIHECFENLGKDLPYWEVDYDSEQVNSEILDTLRDYDKVIVFGIYFERCVKELTRRLKQCGINAIANEDNSVSSRVIGEYL